MKLELERERMKLEQEKIKMELENQYNVRFSMDEMSQLTSIANIIKALSKKISQS